MVTKPLSHQCCQHSLEQRRSPCAHYPRLLLWASPASRDSGETSFQRASSCLHPAGHGHIQLWEGSCPSLGKKEPWAWGSCSKGLSSSRPEKGGQCRGRRKAWETGNVCSGVSWHTGRLGNTSTSCSSCHPGTLQGIVPGMGLCHPGTCTAAEEPLKKEVVKTMNLKMRNKPIRNESI